MVYEMSAGNSFAPVPTSNGSAIVLSHTACAGVVLDAVPVPQTMLLNVPSDVMLSSMTCVSLTLAVSENVQFTLEDVKWYVPVPPTSFTTASAVPWIAHPSTSVPSAACAGLATTIAAIMPKAETQPNRP